MKFLVREWLQMSKEERFWLLENEAYRQWKDRKNKNGSLAPENR
jgi:hypothetical protein